MQQPVAITVFQSQSSQTDAHTHAHSMIEGFDNPSFIRACQYSFSLNWCASPKGFNLHTWLNASYTNTQENAHVCIDTHTHASPLPLIFESIGNPRSVVCVRVCERERVCVWGMRRWTGCSPITAAAEQDYPPYKDERMWYGNTILNEDRNRFSLPFHQNRSTIGQIDFSHHNRFITRLQKVACPFLTSWHNFPMCSFNVCDMPCLKYHRGTVSLHSHQLSRSSFLGGRVRRRCQRSLLQGVAL